MGFGKVLPEKFLRYMSPEDRKKLGKAGLTKEECVARQQVKSEKELQRQLISYLRLKGIEPIYQRMDKRTRTKVGTPDILFAIQSPDAIRIEADVGFRVGTEVFACAWECKFSDGKASEAQKDMAQKMTTPPNGWRHKVIRSLQEAIEELRATFPRHRSGWGRLEDLD